MANWYSLIKQDLKNMNDEDLDKEIAFIKKLLG